MISFEPLKKQMYLKGISISQLSKMSGIQEGQIENYINYSSVPFTIKIEKICKALNCKIEDVISWEDSKLSLKEIKPDWNKLLIKMKCSGYSLRSLSYAINKASNYLNTHKLRNQALPLYVIEKICLVLNCSKEDFI